VIFRRIVGPGRRFSLRRPFLISGFLGFCFSVFTPIAALAQDGLSPHISGRQARLARDVGGAYRVVEVVQVRLEGAADTISAFAEPLPLLVLPDQARAVNGLGGDLAPGQVMEFESHICLVGDLPAANFEFAVTYTLPAEAARVDFAARAPTDSLVLLIDRGSVEARPDPAFTPKRDGGTARQPRRQYVVRDLPAGRSVSVALAAGRLTQRDRLAVLVATMLAASMAGGWVWRGRAKAAAARESAQLSADRSGN
jgi:hypothetical protein